MPSAALSSILADLERHKTIFDLDRHGLGAKLMDATAEQILRDMIDEKSPDGAPWARLSEAYAEYKAKVAPGQPISVLFGHMRTIGQLKGLRRAAAREAVMVYGVDDLARDLATWFQEGSSRQPARPFYGISAECEARLDQICREHLESLV